jgi:hypothetical protein
MAQPLMKTCHGKGPYMHPQVVYLGDLCPVCVACEIIEGLEAQIEELSEDESTVQQDVATSH